MIRNRKSVLRRCGFTLVELLVAAALAITIMWILAESFKMGIDFARAARSTGDMLTQLNNAGQILTRDVQAQHFYVQGAMRNANPSVTINNAMPDLLSIAAPNAPAAAGGYTPPGGYFMLISPPPNTATPSSVSFPDDSEFFSITTNNPSTTMPVNGVQTGCQLAFTVFLPQGMPQNQFVAASPAGSGNIYYSRAAELGFFLGSPNGAGQPTGFTPSVLATPDMAGLQPYLNANPQPVYNLYRRQRLVAVNSDYAQEQLGVAPAPPNLSAPIPPTVAGQANPYYDPHAADVISFTPFPANQVPNFGVNMLYPTTYPNNYSNSTVSFNAAHTFAPTGKKKGFPPAPVPAARVPLTPLTTPGRIGDDILLTNVLSFEVLAVWNAAPFVQMAQPTNPPLPVPGPRPFTVQNNTPNPNIPGGPTYTASSYPLNSNYPFDFLPLVNFNPSHPYTFDTWFQIGPVQGHPNIPAWNNYTLVPNNTNLIPLPIRITALQITIRIYDPKTKQARQNTWRIAV